MQDPKIFFHLGPKKTGSTYLQRNVFPRLKGIKYYNKSKFRSYKEKINTGTHEKYLFSREFGESLKRISRDISVDFPEARIILVLRRQDSWIASKYKYHIKKYGSMSFNEFFELESDTGFWKKEDLCYRKKIEWIEKHFQHKPLILIYDVLKTNPELFVEQITDYLGVQIDEHDKINKVENRAYSDKQLRVLRKINQFYPYQNLKSGIKILDRIHFKFRGLLLYISATLVQFIPDKWLETEALIVPEELEKIRQYYQADWEYCKQYMK